MKVKHIFKELFSQFYLKIKSGPLRGKKWIATSGGKFIKGEHEPYKSEAIVKHFDKGEIFYDIGAHIGYFSAIAAMINDGAGMVIAFEPRPMNARFFRRHIKKNNFKGVTLYEAAVGEEEKMVLFDTSWGSATGRVSDRGKLEVRQVSIDRLVEKGEIPLPTFVKIDVEGGEIEVIKGLRDVIEKARPKMVVATHNDECHRFVTEFLRLHNYSFEILNPGRVKGDTEIIALPGKIN